MAHGIKPSDMDKPWARRRIKRRRVDSVPVRCRFLIISEDTKSSCYYFEELGREMLQGYVFVTVCGIGKNTESLVSDVGRIREEEEKKLVDRGLIDPHFDQIWVVFDKDGFEDDDFDNACAMAEALPQCHAAWSNECFEYWYLLHFNKYSSDMSRADIFRKLKEVIPDYANRFGNIAYEKIKGEQGKKFHEEMAHSIMREQAIKWAREQELYWEDDEHNTLPNHSKKPMTKVHLLVTALNLARSMVIR